MKDQLWVLNQAWSVGLKWRRFSNALRNFGACPKFGVQKTSYFGPLFVTFALDTAYLHDWLLICSGIWTACGVRACRLERAR